MNTALRYKTFIERNFSVVSIDGKTVPFLLNPMQDTVLKDMTGMDMILKARRHGISTLVLAMFTVDFLTVENFRAVVVSHETKATQRLLDKVQFFLDSMVRNLPANVSSPMKLKYSSRNEIVNEMKNSSFYIGTAGSKAFGRGDQISALHLSECAYYADLEKFLIGILPAVQGGTMSLETTANGYNYFRTLWMRNEEKQSPFKTHFIPWFENPLYVLPCSDTLVWTPEEMDIKEKYHLNNNQMAWRRYELDRFNGDVDKFAQEYPANAEEAFIVSGNHVWSPSLLRWFMNKAKEPITKGNLYGVNPTRFEEHDQGYLRIFEHPKRGHTYVIGADVAEGKNKGGEKEGDASCAQVWDQTTMEQVAVWHGRMDPDLFGKQLHLLGMYYNQALLAVEKNSIGLTTLTTLRDCYYPNLYYREKFGMHAERITDEMGWVTDRMTKDLIVSLSTQLLREKSIKIYDEPTLGEMMGFIRNSSGGAEAASGYHDDRVMAMMIALKMISVPQQSLLGNPIERDTNQVTGMSFTSSLGEGSQYGEDFSNSTMIE